MLIFCSFLFLWFLFLSQSVSFIYFKFLGTINKEPLSRLTDFVHYVKAPPPHCSYQIVSTWMQYQPKLNEKYMPFLFLHCISSFESTSYKNVQDSDTSFTDKRIN